MNKENQPPDRERKKPTTTPQNTTKLQKSKPLVFSVGDSMVKEVDGLLLTSSLKHQYLVKTRRYLAAKTIDMYNYLKPAQRDFKPEIFVLQGGTNDLFLNKSPKQFSEDIVTLAE